MVPRRVVTRITPLAPRTPNTAVDEASFNIETFSISLGSKSVKSLSTPSTKTNGEAPPLLNVPFPRI